MKCFFCGKKSNEIVCDNCLSKTSLEDYYQRLISFNNEDDIFQLYLKENNNNRHELCKNHLNNLIRIYGEKDDFTICKLFNYANAENATSKYKEYITKHLISEEKTQIVLNMYLKKMMVSNYEEAAKLCELIENEDSLYAELFIKCGRFYSMVGDYDKAEEILSKTLNRLKKGELKTIYKTEESFSDIEEFLKSNEKYRNGKPYKPRSLDMQEKLKKIYETKNLKFAEKKKESIKESEFAPLNISNTYYFDKYVIVKVDHIKGIKVELPYRISAIKVVKNKKETYEEYIASFDSNKNAEIVIKHLKNEASKYTNARNVKDVMNSYIEFIKDLPIISFSILGNDGDSLIRLYRKAGYKEIKNEVIDLLDFAADVSKDYDGVNNKRETIIKKLKVEANSEIEKDLKVYKKLCKQ